MIINILKNILFLDRAKAFIVDIFMIYMPILYIATYLILGSKDKFIDNHFAIFVCFLLYNFIICLMFIKKGQTLGYMYSKIFLLKDNDDKVGILFCLLRVFLFYISMTFLFGFLFPFINKDRKTFHDFLCKTKVIKV